MKTFNVTSGGISCALSEETVGYYELLKKMTEFTETPPVETQLPRHAIRCN